MDADADKIDDCDHDATTNYVFERIRTANKKLKHSTLRLISNRLDSDKDYSISVNNDDNFSSYDNLIGDKTTTTTTTYTDTFRIIWIYIKDLLTMLANSIGHTNSNEHDTMKQTDNNFEFSGSNGDFDYFDNSNYFNIFDNELNADDFSEKHKLLRQKFLGKFIKKKNKKQIDFL